ncbi:MAG: cupredoxin domain-containing protein [Thiobacillus sp.]|nr:cupredoxin domain-containing protein [Thiobacillus sp.]
MKASVPCLVFCLGLVGYGHADVAQPGETVYRASPAADGVQHVRIEGGAYFFKPNRVVVKSNVPVELTVSVARSMVPHSFVLQAPEAGIAVDEDLSSEPKKIRFTPTTAGSYPFYCRNQLLFFESHREKGMEGVLDVVE